MLVRYCSYRHSPQILSTLNRHRPNINSYIRLHQRTFHSYQTTRMNVTKENFGRVCQELSSLLPTASFVGIDEEMTGIHMPGVFVERMDDSTEERYQKMKTVAEYYKIIQIGLCLFHKDETRSSADEPRYVARPYNFYLFPTEGQVNMEASAIAFNMQHKMDFNKWIYEGIPYVTEASELAIREKFYGDGWQKEVARRNKQLGIESTVVEEQKSQDGDAMMVDEGSAAPVPAASPASDNGRSKKKTVTLDKDGDVTFVEGVKAQIGAWLATRGEQDHELLLPECNSFLRLALHQWFDTVTSATHSDLLGKWSRDDLFLETRPVPGQKWKSQFVLCHYSAEERQKLEEQAKSKKREDYDTKLGFRRVWSMLRQAARPIVVHNGFYDLLFMWTHFESALLPATLPEFKLEMGKKFPAGIYDTKYLSNNRQFLFPWEHLAKLSSTANASSELSASAQKRVEAYRSAKIAPEVHNICRFRETHLEKLYLVLKKEAEARNGGGTATNGSVPASSSSSPAPLVGPSIHGGSNLIIAPPPPFGGVSVTLAEGFDKYALVGQPGGDDSAAHEAGYDAYMTALIFAHFSAEAPSEEISGPLSLGSAEKSKWLNRVPLYRHLQALNLNVDPLTGLPIEDSLVDATSTIYLVKGFPNDWKNDDVLRMFEEKYTSQKRKMEDKSAPIPAPSGDAMVDVGESDSSAPSTSIVTAAPRIIWIDDQSLFLTIVKEDTKKMDAFLENYLKNKDANVIPEQVQITKFAKPK